MKRFVVLFSAVVVGFSPGVAQGATALIVGGAGPYAQLSDEQITTALGGYFADHHPRINVPFPGWAGFAYSIDVGADNLIAAIEATEGPKTIGGVSKGAPVIDEVLRRLMDDPYRPPRAELNAVIYGYPNRTVFARNGVEYRPLPATPYDVLIVKAQYDGLSDWPDNTLNLLAVLNALAGSAQLHVDSAFYDIDLVPREAPWYVETTNALGGTTTSILIPTPILPLLRPLAPGGVANSFVRSLDSVLRPIIDSAYDRTSVPVRVTRTAVSASDESHSGGAEWVTPRTARPITGERKPDRLPLVTGDTDDSDESASASPGNGEERAPDRRSDEKAQPRERDGESSPRRAARASRAPASATRGVS